MAHPLAKYLEDEELTHEAFAKKAGIERTVVTKVLNGKRKRFSVEYARRIEKATSGRVTLEDALGLTARAKTQAA